MILSIFNSQFSLVNFLRTLTAEHLICLAGLVLLAYWLLKTSFGARALADAAPRRNNMPFFLPLIPLFIWFGPIPMIVLTAEKLAKDSLQNWQIAFMDNCIFSAGAVVTIAVILLLARAHFVRRLKGFGLNIKAALYTCIFIVVVPGMVGMGVILPLTRTHFGRRLRVFINSLNAMLEDFLYACVNLLAVWPLIMAAVILTTFFGEQIWGQDYQMQQHQELELITEYSQLPLRIVIVIVAVIVAPLLEELLFRGLIQTTLVSHISYATRGAPNNEPRTIRNKWGVWLAIAISSGLFAMMHANPGHWPALFVLSVCLGYAYEKSGSLFRPIFIHSFFNAISIAAALSQA
jgi:membrane protease YdiL (CAAX protease family)